MFAKKNKSGGTAHPQEPQPMRPSGGGSLFAPGLNPSPSHFNFDSIGRQQATFESNPAPTDIPAPPPLHWDPTPSYETDNSFAATAAVAEPAIPEVVPAWAPPEVSIEPEPMAQASPAPWEEAATETTSFEAPVLGDLPPLAPEMYLPEPAASNPAPAMAESSEQFDWEPLSAPEENAVSFQASAQVSTTTQSFQTAAPLPIPETPDTDWAAWNPPGAPGETSALDPATFLDTVNQQLYPEDPFADPMTAVEGAQAFEDAAQFLFPETATASLDWQDDSEVTSFLDTGFSLEVPTAEPLELGPSYQPMPGDLNDLSAIGSSDAELSTFMEAAAATNWTESPELNVVETFETAASWETPFSNNLTEDLTPELTEDLPDFGLSPLPGQAEADLLAAYTMGDEGSDLPISSELSEAFEDAYEFSNSATSEESPALEMPDMSNWGATVIEPTLPTDYTPPESIETDLETSFIENVWTLENTDLTQDVIEQPPALSPIEFPSEPVPTLEPISEPAAPTNSLAAFLSEDDDFYASSFTLSEQGDVIPSYEAPSTPIIEISDAFEPTFEVTEPVAPVAPFILPEMEASLPSPPPMEIISTPEPETIPITHSTASVPPSAEELWETPALGETPAPTPEVAQPALSFDNLEILGVCQLSADKRLLLVQSQENFALMGQAGLENPQITVLKIFDHNPIAYQNTFAAAQEGQAGAQGMYVTQVGTWHAIISTFQDQIVLHTELG